MQFKISRTAYVADARAVRAQFWTCFTKAVALNLIAILILAQRDVDGQVLVHGFKSLYAIRLVLGGSGMFYFAKAAFLSRDASERD